MWLRPDFGVFLGTSDQARVFASEEHNTGLDIIDIPTKSKTEWFGAAARGRRMQDEEWEKRGKSPPKPIAVMIVSTHPPVRLCNE